MKRVVAILRRNGYLHQQILATQTCDRFNWSTKRTLSLIERPCHMGAKTPELVGGRAPGRE
jgi:hypothetical protein